MYADYLKEHHGDETLETEFGFATYRYLGNGQVYIVDIYVVPEKRHTKWASQMADAIVMEAKEKGCTELLGSVVPSAKKATTSLKVLLGYGMEILNTSQDLIVFRRGI